MFDWDPDLPGRRRPDRLARLGQHDAGRNALLGRVRAGPATSWVITGSGFRDLVQWTLWGGVACMVTSGLFSFALQWRSIVRAFGNLGSMFSRGEGRGHEEVDAIERPPPGSSPGSSFRWSGWPCWPMRVSRCRIGKASVAVLLSFFLALVACRVTGETDTTPIGAMGKVTQLILRRAESGQYEREPDERQHHRRRGRLAADLLTDLKSGYLLGANPRKQFLAQFAGIFVGTVVTVLCFRVMVPDASVLGSDRFPAPAAQPGGPWPSP